jgi:flavin-dependent dehydrogenase
MSEPGFGPLSEGGNVVIIGGGPGGAATALALQRGARALGRRIHITVVEGKQFAGEHQYNPCVGVLSPPIMELIEKELDIPFPHQLSRQTITGYVLHTARHQIVLDGETEPSIALRRVQFDAYMMEMVRQREIEIVQARLTDLEFHADGVMVYTESQPLKADVVVGAFGLDDGTAEIFSRAVGYHSPAALSSIVTKYHPGESGMAEFGQRIHAFLPAIPQIEFGGITPKGNHLTINIAGSQVTTLFMDAFINLPEVHRALPCLENAGHFDSQDLRYYKGRFPCGLARKITGDRFVVVGDAAGLVRAFKGKGITSAILTGSRAAQVILQHGISASAFDAYLQANQDILSDLPYGQAMRRVTILASRVGFMNVVMRAAEHTPQLYQALFDAVSAHRSYSQVVRKTFAPASVWAICKAIVNYNGWYGN